jgi:hypothetical protein
MDFKGDHGDQCTQLKLLFLALSPDIALHYLISPQYTHNYRQMKVSLFRYLHVDS